MPALPECAGSGPGGAAAGTWACLKEPRWKSHLRGLRLREDRTPSPATGSFSITDGYPAIAPPWGTLNAIDLKTGKYLWKIPFGEYPELAAKGLKNTGTENYGGPVVTAGGVLFIGATIYDRKFRAFDTSNGKLLWETELPFSGVATPATYEVDGRQFVVIGASGARDAKAKQGGAYVAFALPK